MSQKMITHNFVIVDMLDFLPALPVPIFSDYNKQNCCHACSLTEHACSNIGKIVLKNSTLYSGFFALLLITIKVHSALKNPK